MTDKTLRFGRRALVGGTLAGGVLAGVTGCAGKPAQAQLRIPVVNAPATPCASHPGDIVGLLLHGAGSPDGTVVVFGQTFVAGHLPRGMTLAARLADGRRLPTQCDVTTRNGDGSARFAVVSVAAPALPAGRSVAVVLSRVAASPSDTAPLTVEPLLAGRSAIVEIIPEGGGTPFTVDLLAGFRAALGGAGGATAVWQAGPLAVQARVALPIPAAAVGGAGTARLAADVSVRADGALHADVWVRNDIAMRPDGKEARYALRVMLDGREVLASGPLRQFQYTGWGRHLAAARTGAAPAAPSVRPDIGYMHDSGAIARYDLSVGVAEALLARADGFTKAQDWDTPFAPRRITMAMGMAGNREDLGPVTRWQAAWLVSGDRRAERLMMGQAEAAGAIPWHVWDPASGGAEPEGAWMDARRWPELWLDPRGGRPPKTLTQHFPRESEWRLSSAHQPALSFLPYLVTGRRAFLDGQMAQACWNIMNQWPYARAEATGTPAVRDLNVIMRNQVRGAAWALRTMGDAAWVGPDNHPNQAYLRAAVAANFAWARNQGPILAARHGEHHGWWPPTAHGVPEISPWQQEFFASTAATEARRGSEDARAVLAWMGNFLVGRFFAGDKGFNPRDGIAYTFPVAAQDDPNRVVTTWREVGDHQRAKGQSNEDGWRRSNGYYGPLALVTLAMMQDLFDTDEIRRARAWLVAAAPPYTSVQNYANDPTYNIVPRGEVRVPARAPRCVAVQPMRG